MSVDALGDSKFDALRRMITGFDMSSEQLAGIGSGAGGGEDEDPEVTELPEDFEERNRVLTSRGRSGTILTGGALSQTNQPTVRSALLGGNP